MENCSTQMLGELVSVLVIAGLITIIVFAVVAILRAR
jgi:hypothetical protein